MKKILIKYLMISCKEATFLMAKKEEGKLTLVERLKLSVHTSMCSICKNFEEQTAHIAKESRHVLADESLSEEAKENIEKTLEDKSS